MNPLLIQFFILAAVALAGYVFIRVMLKSYEQKGYLQGRQDEYQYQQEEIAKLIKTFCQSAIVTKEQLNKIVKKQTSRAKTSKEVSSNKIEIVK